jgi:hypothetical protein
MKPAGICLALGLLAGATIDESPYVDDSPMKGIRAMIFHGPSLPAPVIVEEELATSLHNAFVRGALTGAVTAERRLEGRACIGVAVFRQRTNAMYQAAHTLRPDDADVRWWFFPAVGDDPATFMTRYQLASDVVDRLDELGVPTTTTAAGNGGACEFERRGRL